MEMKKARYEALSDFKFMNIETGLYFFVKAGEQYRINKLDRVHDSLNIVSFDGVWDAWISLYEFVTHFVEVLND